jgi:hypothetical protein
MSAIARIVTSFSTLVHAPSGVGVGSVGSWPRGLRGPPTSPTHPAARVVRVVRASAKVVRRMGFSRLSRVRASGREE